MNRINAEKLETDHRDTSGVHLWLVLFKAAKACQAAACLSIRDTKVGLSDFGVLEALLHKGPLRVGELGRKVLLTSGSMTAAVDRLESKGLVERAPEKGDRRAIQVGLTSAGRSLIRKAFAEHAAVMEQIAGSLTPEERAGLMDLLRRLGRSAERRIQVPEPAGSKDR